MIDRCEALNKRYIGTADKGLQTRCKRKETEIIKHGKKKIRLCRLHIRHYEFDIVGNGFYLHDGDILWHSTSL